MGEIYRDKDWLIEHYVRQDLSRRKCAEMAGCIPDTISYWLERHGIPRRTISEAMKVAHEQGLWSREETKQKRSEARKKAWARGDYNKEEVRQKRIKGIKAARVRGCYDDMYTVETRRKISEGAKAAHARGVLGSEEIRRKQSDSMKAAWERGCWDSEETWQKQSETTKAAWERGVYDGVFQSPTSIEIAISEALDDLGIMHVTQYRPEGCSYTYDEYLLAQGILLEVNGDYWHTLPGKAEKDACKEAWAREHGFLPVVIWESEIKERGALAMIQSRLGEGSGVLL